jgi:hypothetical protein
MFATTKKKVVTLLAILGIAAVSTAAYAYWTAGGTGTGSGTAGDVTAITVNQTKVLTPMFPGDTAQTLNGTFNNPNTGNVFVATVTASIASVTKATGAPAGTCDATDFTLANATMTVNQDVAAGPSQGTWSGATIKFNNKASNQNACKNATVNLGYVSA